jgi:hypothetical protein
VHVIEREGIGIDQVPDTAASINDDRFQSGSPGGNDTDRFTGAGRGEYIGGYVTNECAHAKVGNGMIASDEHERPRRHLTMAQCDNTINGAVEETEGTQWSEEPIVVVPSIDDRSW